MHFVKKLSLNYFVSNVFMGLYFGNTELVESFPKAKDNVLVVKMEIKLNLQIASSQSLLCLMTNSGALKFESNLRPEISKIGFVNRYLSSWLFHFITLFTWSWVAFLN